MEKRVVSDFGLGAWQVRRSDLKQPVGSLRSLVDAHVDSAGTVRGRGPVTQKIATALDRALGGFVWAGRMLPGRRGLMFSIDSAATIGRSRPFDPDAPALGIGAAITSPVDNFTVVGNMLVMGQAGASNVSFFGGSLKNTQTGVTNLTRTAGSPVVTKAGGTFQSGGLFDVGMVVPGWQGPGPNLSTATPGIAVLASIDSDTQITMDRPSPTTDVVSASFFGPGVAPVLYPAAVGGGLAQGLVGSVAGRLLVMKNNRLIFSRGPDPATGGPRTDQFQVQDVHEFPVDADAIAIYTLRDRVFVFTQAGNFAVSGMAYEIVDGSGTAQHPIEQLTGKSVALSQRGIVAWQGALIVPCRDGIYVMDGYGSPVLLSRSVPWAEMVRDGLELGFASVYQERYILPYRYAGETHQLVFRTDGRDTDVGTVFPASTFSMPPNLFAVAADKSDSLLGVGDAAGGLLECGKVFSEGLGSEDYDTTAAAGGMVFESGPIVLGDKGVVRRVRVRYTWLNGVATATPQLVVTVNSKDGTHTETKALAIDTTGPATRWVAIDLDTPAEGDVVTVSLSLSGAKPGAFDLHALEVQYRAFGGL